MNFKSKAAYGKWLAYGHMHGQFAKTPGNQAVSIKGKSKKVNHNAGAGKKSAHARAVQRVMRSK